MSDRQPRVTQEGEGEVRVPADPSEAGAQGPVQRGELGRTHIGEFAGLHGAPDWLNRIELGRIRGQALHGQPGSLAREVRAHPLTLVRAQPIPDEEDPVGPEVVFERPQEPDERGIGVAARLGPEEEAGAAPIPAKGQCGRDGQALPVPARRPQDRRFPPRGPRPADDWLLGDAAFVLEDEPRAVPAGVFFSRAQRRVFHCAIAASSRSRARRAGRCSDQPIPRRSRQT